MTRENTTVFPLGAQNAASDPDAIRVFVRDCHVDLHVGVYDSEMRDPQPVIINVELEAALPHRYQDTTEKKLNRVIDYSRIYNYMREELPRMGHIYLLETIAEHILDFCFQDLRVMRAHVRLEKTAIFPHAAGAGIDISRARPPLP